MGHGVTTYAAPHALIAWERSTDDAKPWYQIITERECWIEAEQERLYEEAGGGAAGDAAADAWTPPDTYEVNGWLAKKSDDHDGWETLDRKNIWATILRKGEQAVYALNSSQYNNVGEHELTIFADDLEALVDFCNDTGLDSFQIESPGVVEQWG